VLSQSIRKPKQEATLPAQEYLIVDHLSTKDITRIFKRIIITESGCWEWRGARLKQSGYGVLRYQRRTEIVHRLLYAWTTEKLPQRKRGEPFGDDDRELDHLHCSNKHCCNPVHMALVAHKSNSLRSDSPSAINARKTHCIHGHPLPLEPVDEGNGVLTRRCLPCRRKNSNRRYHARQAALSAGDGIEAG
jgi:hypothetical protein